MLFPMRLRPLPALVVTLGATLSTGLLVLPPAAGVPPAPEAFVPRWCSAGAPPPCLESAIRTSVPVASSSTDWQVQQTAQLNDVGHPYCQWQVVAVGSTPLTSTVGWWLTLNTG